MARNREILNFITTTDIPSTTQKRYEYNGDGTVLYAGSAPRGEATSDDTWTITKYTYSSQQVTVSQTAFDSWDNRASAAYT